MGNCTPTERNSRAAEGVRPARPQDRCALLWMVPAALGEMAGTVLSGFGLRQLHAEKPQELRDALYDEDVAIVLVSFGRDIPSGVAACRAVRRHPRGERVPIVAAISADFAARFPFDCGADDAISVPFSLEEGRLCLGFALWRNDIGVSSRVVKLGDIVVDPAAMRVRLKGAPVDLTYKEFALLQCFLDNLGIALKRSQILDSVWGADYYGGDRTVDIHVRRLRAKLPPLAERIETVHGVGYRFSGQPQSQEAP